VGSTDAMDPLESTIACVDTAAAADMAGASGAAAIARSVGVIEATPPARRPATLVNLAVDGCKYGVGEVAVEECGRHATARTVHVFCNRPRVSSTPYCAAHEQVCRSNERSLPAPHRRPQGTSREIREHLKAKL
jgi:hypothetical protein